MKHTHCLRIPQKGKPVVLPEGHASHTSHTSGLAKALALASSKLNFGLACSTAGMRHWHPVSAGSSLAAPLPIQPLIMFPGLHPHGQKTRKQLLALARPSHSDMTVNCQMVGFSFK